MIPLLTLLDCDWSIGRLDTCKYSLTKFHVIRSTFEARYKCYLTFIVYFKCIKRKGQCLVNLCPEAHPRFVNHYGPHTFPKVRDNSFCQILARLNGEAGYTFEAARYH